MEGYEVVTNDGHKAGHVVAVEGDLLVIEHGALRKQRHALPRELAHVDDDARLVRATVAREILDESPKIHRDVDARAVAAYYGLGAGFEAPATEGYGELAPDETARTAEGDAREFGLPSDEEERLRVRERLGPDEGRLDRPIASPGATGGDRYRDSPAGLDHPER